MSAPDPLQLARLQPFDRLDPERRARLARRLQIRRAGRGEVLLEMGDRSAAPLYLLEGEVELQAHDGARTRIRHDQPSARSPIARLRPARFRVIARSPVRYLRVPEPLLDQTEDSLPNYEVVEIDAAGAADDPETRLALRIYQDLEHGRLLLPSLPDIAIRVGRAVGEQLADARRVARIVENDPAIAAKLLRAANSARFGGVRPVSALPEAVARLGLRQTHRLVVAFALRELFRGAHPRLAEAMRRCWERARRAAAVAHVLAPLCRDIDADSALLAGLVHNLGDAVALAACRELPAHDAALPAAAISRLGRDLTPRILDHWDFPEPLVTAVREARAAPSVPAGAAGGLLRIALALAEDEAATPDAASCAALGLGEDGPERIRERLGQAQRLLAETLALLGD